MSAVRLNLKRCSMYLSEDLLKRVDDYALRMGLNRTAAISSLVGTALDEKDAIRNIQDATTMMKRGNVD